MPQLTIYVDEQIAQDLDRAARERGMSRSALAQEAIRAHLRGRFSERWLALGGTWKDDRTAEEIIADIRADRASATARDLSFDDLPPGQ